MARHRRGGVRGVTLQNINHCNRSFIAVFLTCDSEGDTGSEDEMGEGGRRNRGEGVMVTGMLSELLLVAIVLGAEEVRMIRLSGIVSVLGL